MNRPFTSESQPSLDLRHDGQALVSISRERLPTNTTANRHAIHRWFNFIAGFSPEFVTQQCANISGGTLLDPFAGCGTSLVVAQSHGIRAIGYEPHPFFVRIARAKTAEPSTSTHLARIECALLRGIARPDVEVDLSHSADTFLAKLFSKSTLRQLLNARASLRESALDSDDLAFLILSRVVEMCSTAQTDGIYKAPTTSKRASLPTDAIQVVVDTVRSDTESGLSVRKRPSATLHQATAEQMADVPDRSVDIVVTSPPYLNNFDFAEMARMHLYFWGTCANWREITQKVRANLIVNTTTALAGQRHQHVRHRDQIPQTLLPELDGIVRALAIERTGRAGRKDYHQLVYPYFGQMTRVLQESQRCLSPGMPIHIVVADSALYGVHISTPEFLARTLSELGFENVQCIKLRARGHRWLLSKRDGSPIGLGEYHILARRGS